MREVQLYTPAVAKVFKVLEQSLYNVLKIRPLCVSQEIVHNYYIGVLASP